MVYCFAFGCNNNSSSGKSTFAFPPDTKQKKFLRKKWIAACNRNKKDIDRAKYPRLCEDHFSPDSFSKLPEIARLIGCRLDLKEDAVPDPHLFIKVAKHNKESDPCATNVTRRSLAFQKRKNLDMLDEIMTAYESSTNDKRMSSDIAPVASVDSNDNDLVTPVKPTLLSDVVGSSSKKIQLVEPDVNIAKEKNEEHIKAGVPKKIMIQPKDQEIPTVHDQRKIKKSNILCGNNISEAGAGPIVHDKKSWRCSSKNAVSGTVPECNQKPDGIKINPAQYTQEISTQGSKLPNNALLLNTKLTQLKENEPMLIFGPFQLIQNQQDSSNQASINFLRHQTLEDRTIQSQPIKNVGKTCMLNVEPLIDDRTIPVKSAPKTQVLNIEPLNEDITVPVKCAPETQLLNIEPLKNNKTQVLNIEPLKGDINIPSENVPKTQILNIEPLGDVSQFYEPYRNILNNSFQLPQTNVMLPKSDLENIPYKNISGSTKVKPWLCYAPDKKRIEETFPSGTGGINFEKLKNACLEARLEVCPALGSQIILKGNHDDIKQFEDRLF